jgi:hypothetical protein
MALSLTKTDSSGNTISYWRLSPWMHVDFVAKQVRCTVLGYKDQTARDAGKEPNPLANSPSIGMPAFVELTGDPAITAVMTGDARATLYTVAKAMDEFNGATDVLET